MYPFSPRHLYTFSLRLPRQTLWDISQPLHPLPTLSSLSTLLAHTYIFASSWNSSSIRLLNFVEIVEQSFFLKQL
jgi:hypothetical protein